MKRWHKVAMIPAVPTLTALHERWLAYLLGIEWASIDGCIKVLGVMIVSACVIGLLFASEVP